MMTKGPAANGGALDDRPGPAIEIGGRGFVACGVTQVVAVGGAVDGGVGESLARPYSTDSEPPEGV
ncbi:hypothetical protein QFZ49_007215 [Streptomyces turgidiscabies]|uniref:Uncharacterized protein n=1 Tax=Streptomyces turgidiscabies TaxID=85558 RepID=A0ABU0RZ22_9ACTN|nr:hypothetical protein [Streptomyces turgidiscabies]